MEGKEQEAVALLGIAGVIDFCLTRYSALLIQLRSSVEMFPREPFDSLQMS